MPKKMLVDAAYAEESRVVVINNGVITEFDCQNSQKKATKGNIYLAKIARIEPSLQAAFVDYGGAKHGFLPFSEIHPDYYQVPVSDREQLLEELNQIRTQKINEALKINEPKTAKSEGEASIEGREVGEEQDVDNVEGEATPAASTRNDDESYDEPQFYKRYKIQEVLKKDQVLLVQIEKEERGNKGAALTTYISLAGRFCVYMPNATKGGGISKKISDSADRDRLRRTAIELTSEMDRGSVIIRTAGSFKTKTEIKKDLGYLQKLWKNICEHTVKSNAPTFIHEEADVIKKAIRDLYDSDIEEIVVQGEDAYNSALEFMRMILPKHANKLTLYKEPAPIFTHFNIERKIAELYSTDVQLQSGGYIILNQTEALVAIDVNSGRSTSERNVENTALRTNLEAAEKIAEHIMLRDLSGLIVIDFIDMEKDRNRSAVERALREALAKDKAKIQMSKISGFGILEMSRQRLRQSFIESHTQTCESCSGRGRVRRLEPSAIAVLRALEAEIASASGNQEIQISGSSRLMSYILNNKRKELVKFDERYGGKIVFSIDESAGADGFFMERKKGPREMQSNREALSKVDNIQVAEKQEEAVSTDHKSKGGKNFKFRIKKNKVSDSSATFVEFMPGSDDQMLDKQPQEFIPQNKVSGGKKQKFKGRNKRHGRNPNQIEGNSENMSPEMFDDTDIEFDADMAAKRKQNQSLLKEIWKKIID